MVLFVRSNEVHFRVEHWDVNNENLHGDFYERHTGNPNITMQMFRDIQNVDQNVKLFLNEFGIVEGGNGNVATVSKGLQLLPCNYLLSKSLVHGIKFGDIAGM